LTEDILLYDKGMAETPIIPEKSCKNCIHYRPYQTWHMKQAVMQCEGDAANHVVADASDDTGLQSWFRPPETFCCSGCGEK